MENIKGFAIELDLDHLSVDRGLKGLQDNLKTVNSEMKRNMSAFDYSEKSVKKYETSLSGMNKKLQVQKRAVAEAEKEYKKMVDEHGRGSKEAEKAAQEYNNQAAALNNLERYIEKTKDELAKFTRQQEIAESGWTKLGDKLETYGGRLKGFGDKMTDVGSTLNRKVTLPLVALGGIAGKVGSDFEAGMSRVGAVSGASADDMERLEEKAREMGATTVFSASEASDAFYYMSLAGWKASDMLDGISGVMDLAAASGEDLGLVSDIVTDGLTAFGLSAKESARMADVLASASANANTDVAGLGQAFSYVAPVAGALGYTMEDTSKAIGLMANSGIKSTKAGTALRTMMTNLAKPTKEMKKAMDKYGISLTDSEGNMKSFDDVMLDLRKGLGKLDKDQQAAAASTIFGKEAMSGALAIVNASEEDYKKLSKAINESDGSAKKMADTMQDNLQGSIKELKSMAEDLFIEMYKNLKPTFESIIDSAKNLTKWFADLSPKTQENIVKFGLLAAAAGPVLSVFGKVAGGAGTILSVFGKISKTLGVASAGSGLLASFLSLGPLAVGGIAIAGLVGIGTAVYKLMKRKDKLNEISTETAEKLYDEAQSLESLADEYDKLTSKSKLTKDEFMRLVDIQAELNRTSDSKKIERLQNEYEKLQKKSGLSADEVGRLISVNNDIVEQSPAVEKAYSNQGNAIVDSTDDLRDYIATIYEMSQLEMEMERAKALENEATLRKENKELSKDILDVEKDIQFLLDNRSLSMEDLNDKLEENRRKHADINTTEEEKAQLLREHNLLEDIRNGKFEKSLDNLKEQRDEMKNKIELNDQELAKLDAINEQYKEMLLGSIGINDENGEGLEILDKQLENLRKQKKEFEKNTTEADKQTEGYRKNLKIFDDQIKRHEDIRDELNRELGLQSEKTKKEEIMNQLLQEETEHNQRTHDAMKKQGEQTDKNNKKTDIGVEKEKERTKEAGKDVDKNVTVKDNGTVNDLNKRATEAKDKRVSMVAVGVASLNKVASEAKNKNVNLKAQGLANINSLASKPVTKTVNFRAGRAVGTIGVASLFTYAKGTPAGGHPGGLAVVGDGGGSELVTLPSGRAFLSPSTDTLLDLPKGSHVTPHLETNRILKSIKFYAEGTPNFGNSDFTRLLMANSRMSDDDNNVGVKRGTDSSGDSYVKELLRATLQQNKILTKLLNKNSDIVMNDRVLGSEIEPVITEIQNRNKGNKEMFV